MENLHPLGVILGLVCFFSLIGLALLMRRHALLRDALEESEQRNRALRKDHERFQEILHQSEKMASVGQLTASVAHEINNPIGVILGFAQSVSSSIEPGDPMELPITSIEREAYRCKILVQDLLTFSRLPSLKQEPMDLNKTIQVALSLVNVRAKLNQIKIETDLAAGLPWFLGNPNQIQQIVINLANNSIDAMGESGTINIRTELLKEGPLAWISLAMSDTGPGIPPELIPNIFEPFFTTKPVGKGTGLGLSLVRDIVREHSAIINVQSHPGHTEFTVKFPVRAPEMERATMPETTYPSSDQAAYFKVRYDE